MPGVDCERMHPGPHALFEQDQRDRLQHLGPITVPLVPLMRFRDWRRRRRVQELIAAGALSAPEDFYHAAMILQHGTRLADYWQAHELAKRAADLGYRPARWLVAAALDRWLMRQGKPQKYGTQYTTVGKWWQGWRIGRKYRLWDVDPATTDEERQEWGVPPLAVAVAYAEALGTEAEKQVPVTEWSGTSGVGCRGKTWCE